MAPEFLIYVGIPALIILVKWTEMRFDRRTKLLVEQERARSMNSLRQGQVDDREKAFQAQLEAIKAAKRRLHDTPKDQPKAHAPAPTQSTQEVTPNAGKPHQARPATWKDAPTEVTQIRPEEVAPEESQMASFDTQEEESHADSYHLGS
jgi:hypothetical protein